MADSTWTGALNNDWNTAGNWTTGVPGAGNTATITSGGATITGNLTNVAQIVLVAGSRTLSGTLTTTGITLNVGAGATLLMSGAIGGAGGVTKTGLGTAQLVSSNTFLGTTTVSAGTLVTTSGALNATSAIVNNATLTAVNCGSGTPLSGSGDTTFSGANLTLGAVDTGNSLTFSAVTGTTTLGSLSGVGTLSVQGPSLVIVNGGTTFIGTLIGFCELTAPAIGGTFTLANSNSYTLGTVVNGGTLKAANVNAFGSGAVQINAGVLNLDSFDVPNVLYIAGGTVSNATAYTGTAVAVAGATVNVTDFPAAIQFAADNGIIDGDGQNFVPFATNFIVANGGTILNATLEAARITAQDGTIDATVTGGGVLVKTGGGTVTLNAANSHLGGTDIQDGTVVIGDDAALGATATIGIIAGTSATLDLDGYAPVVSITANNGTVLNGDNYAGTMTLPPLASMQIPPGNNLAGNADVNATADLNIGGAHTGSINNSGTVTIDNGTAAATPVNVYNGGCGSTYAVQQP